MSGQEYEVIQDFDNKRANAHASLFVASMFGLFSLLALMGRIVDRTLPSFANYAVIILLLLSYIFVWFFGLYSLLNFFFYATVAHYAKGEIVKEKEVELIREAKRGWTWIPRKFASFKEPNINISEQASERKEKRFSHNKETVFVVIYFAIGLLPMVAFWIWFLAS